MYEISAMTTLRFYLATTSKEHVITSDDEDYIPSTVESFTELIGDCQEVVEVSEENPESGNSLANFYGTFINNMQCEENGSIPEIDLDLNSSVTQLPSINYESYNLSVILETNLADNIHQLRQSEISSDLETDTSRISKEKNKIILHRGKVFEEFIEALKTHYIYDFKTITIVMILPNGVPEPAEDLGGVLRDAISEFWDEFYDKCTIGTDYKVPFLRHDFGEPEWRAISKFLVKGWESESYFPIRIAPIFIKHCFEQTIEADDILNNFLKYVCETDANILKGALQDFDTVEYDDLLECVGNYDSKWLPSKNNFRKLLTDIAHKEIIQKPAFVAQCFAQELRGSICNCNLETIYKQLKPTVKNVLSKLETNETNLTPQKITIYGYLKKFIKELDEKSRSAFLRFCTGSDLVIKNVQVHFVDIEGITRSPIAHTCTGILELPTSYENFVVFRTEFNNLLNSKIWVMDIV